MTPDDLRRAQAEAGLLRRQAEAVQAAGYAVAVRGAFVILTDHHPTSPVGLRPAEARALAAALTAAADRAERTAPRRPPSATLPDPGSPDTGEQAYARHAGAAPRRRAR